MRRRPELVGGGLIRSLGGWSEVKKMRLKGMVPIKGDERILGDSDFVLSVLSQANERFERRYELKRRGYDMTRVAERVAKKTLGCARFILLLVCRRAMPFPERACPGTGDDGLRHRLCRKKRRNHRRTRRLRVD
jgi:hypothetical protein